MSGMPNWFLKNSWEAGKVYFEARNHEDKSRVNRDMNGRGVQERVL